MKVLRRSEAVELLKQYIGQDLRILADHHSVTVFKNGKLNKGWAGHTLENCLGLGLSSVQAPNGDTWELKSVPLALKNGEYVVKETMAITMINPKDVLEKEFEESHVYKKLRSIIICGRLFESKLEECSKLISVGTFDLLDEEVKEQVKHDYDLVRKTIKEEGFDSLTGKMGVLIQPRTKGPGHGSISRAFYARKEFVKDILSI